MTTTEVITFPDAVLEVKNYLSAVLPSYPIGEGVQVRQRVPSPRPARLVRPERTGGFKVSFAVDRVQLTVEVWDADDGAAMDLAEIVRGLLFVMPHRYAGCVTYNPTNVGGPVLNPDPDTATPRATFTMSLDFRGAALPEPEEP